MRLHAGSYYYSMPLFKANRQLAAKAAEFEPEREHRYATFVHGAAGVLSCCSVSAPLPTQTTVPVNTCERARAPCECARLRAAAAARCASHGACVRRATVQLAESSLSSIAP